MIGLAFGTRLTSFQVKGQGSCAHAAMVKPLSYFLHRLTHPDGVDFFQRGFICCAVSNRPQKILDVFVNDLPVFSLQMRSFAFLSNMIESNVGQRLRHLWPRRSASRSEHPPTPIDRV